MSFKKTLTAILFFLLGLIVALLIVEYRKPPSGSLLPLVVPAPRTNVSDSQSAGGPETALETKPEKGTLKSVGPQVPGLYVVVPTLTVPESSWIVVRDYSEGARGSILGALRLMRGEYTDVSIQLLRATEKGKQYALDFFTDDGNNTFDVGSDIPREHSESAVFLVE